MWRGRQVDTSTTPTPSSKKSINTLVGDIENYLINPTKPSDDQVDAFGRELATIISEKLSREPKKPYLRLSNLGTPCSRKLWYSINRPELGEKLSPAAIFKFLFGDILEATVLFLAKLTGHAVENQQTAVEIDGVKGHIDGTIDGDLVDVKSASNTSFAKFKAGLNADTDGFGYLSQLGGYLNALSSDPKWRHINPEQAHFLVVGKELGHIHLDTHKAQDVDYKDKVKKAREVLALKEPPPRGYEDVPVLVGKGKVPNGNRKLQFNCAYCDFKKTCWPELRTFLYKSGQGFKPQYLTVVKREPRVSEIGRDGKIINKDGTEPIREDSIGLAEEGDTAPNQGDV